MKMGASLIVFRILFLVLILHSNSLAAQKSQLNEEIDGKSKLLQVSATANQDERWPAISEPPMSEPADTDSSRRRHEEPVESAAVADESVGKQVEPREEPIGERDALNYAELCYLSNGGSSLTLTVNEATQVGSIIGTLEVNGDPSLESGNVDLFIAPDARSINASSSGSTAPDLAADSTTTPSSKQRRVLGRRWADAAGRRVKSGPAAPPLPTPAGKMHGLVSEYPSGGAAGSFYSLVASTATPSHAAPPSPQAPAVRLEPGGRSLVLARALDKESAEGEQGLVVYVRCKARAGRSGSAGLSGKSLDSSTIPVRILITDANDHAPQFVGPQPYVVNISETTPFGSVVSRDILALDRDSAGPFSTLHYRVLEDGAAHSALLNFANPLEPALSVSGPLDYESLSSFTITISAQDQGEPEPLTSSAQVQVNIIDFDDQNPRFLDDKYSLIMDESQQNLVGQNLQVLPRNLYAEDGDRGINAPIVYSFDQLGGFPQATGEQRTTPGSGGGEEVGGSASGNSLAEQASLNIDHYLHLNPTSGELRLIRQWPSKWTGSPMTLVVRATQADNKDRYTLTTLTITRPLISAGSSPRVQHQQPSDKTEAESGRESGDLVSSVARSQQGIQFAPDQLIIDVLENVPINAKVARVHARYLGKETPDSSSSSSDNQAVDLVQDLASNKLSAGISNNKTRRLRFAEATQAPSNKRPINYQILDDQTEQFGINGLGEIMVKRQLDYEAKQEYKFRVLATYTKYSDICRVQVNVINVNDNKPKFTQPQYMFHLTESRLRSNIIGTVQAHDADLNDTIHYSLIGDHAHLFDINSAGQVSLRASIKQLNMSSCQLLAQAQDSLAGGRHTQQARLHLHVAPQLVGRSLNLEQYRQYQQPEANPHARQSEAGELDDARSFNSRSLTDGTWTTPTSSAAHKPAGAERPAGRSSAASVMWSLQQMVRGANFLDMPMSSALLLSALLAFLVCLLFIVIVSMSVHFYRRRTKLRHRHHMTTAAHLRHAHLVAALHPHPHPHPQQPPQQMPLGAAQLASNYMRRPASSLSPADSSPRGDTTASGSAGHTRTRSARSTTPTGGRSSRSKSRQSQQLDNSLISTLSSHSKRSYRSNTTDDSSVMHCGHYSVNASQSPAPPAPPPPSKWPPSGSAAAATAPELQQRRKSAMEAAIKSLVREPSGSDETGSGRDRALLATPTRHVQSQRLRATPIEPPIRQQANEMSALTNSKPGIKSYRKLPTMMGSLVRPLNRVGVAPDPNGALDSGEKGMRADTQDSAIASDASSSSAGGGPAGASKEAASDGLMAMIRDPERRAPIAADNFVGAQSVEGGEAGVKSPAQLASSNSRLNVIRWPEGAMPQRVKKLTWDDELSISNEDCFITPELQVNKLSCPLSPLSNHQYPIQGTTNNHDHYAEQHFLFSNPCSPTLQSADFGSFSSQRPAHLLASGQAGEEPGSMMGQNNCFDYTIVQSSQFHVDAFASERLEQSGGQKQTSLSAQHHHLLQQSRRPPAGYLYSNSFGQAADALQQQQQQAAAANQDLKLITTAVL